MNKMRTLADKWRTSRFPHCTEIQRINQILADFDKITTSLNRILCRKIRLRFVFSKFFLSFEYDGVSRVKKG